MKIAQVKISSKSPLYVAEISGNHAGKYKLLEKTILAAIKSGASAVKIQSYSPDDLTVNSNKSDFLIKGSKNKWNKQYLYDLYKKGQTPVNWLKKVFKFCSKKKIICFASPFSVNSVLELEKFNCPAYKVASLEINNIPLLKAIAKTNKPVIVSTGGSTIDEIKDVIKYFKHNKNFALLKCTVNYPATLDELNLNTIKDLKKRFKNIEVGYSDHTIGDIAAITAVSFGASIIEKHFTLSKKINSIDDFFSSDPKEMETLVKRCNQSILSAGIESYGPTKSEKKSIKYRRSIYVCKKIDKGEKITKLNIRLARPAYSLDPKYYFKILGRESKKKLDIGSRISLKFLK
jgi:pseudaminic acid synthase